MKTKRTQQIACFFAAALGLVAGYAASADPTPQIVSNQTVTSVSDVDYGGEMVSFTVSQPVVTGCTYTNQYAIRDTNIMKGALALLIVARLSGNSVNFYVTGACDSSGVPLVASVTVN
jgi:hypothetical protein